jgi:hypothetical protein
MLGRAHTRETVGLLNVNSIHLNTLFDGSKIVIKCIELAFNNPTVSLV